MICSAAEAPPVALCCSQRARCRFRATSTFPPQLLLGTKPFEVFEAVHIAKLSCVFVSFGCTYATIWGEPFHLHFFSPDPAGLGAWT